MPNFVFTDDAVRRTARAVRRLERSAANPPRPYHRQAWTRGKVRWMRIKNVTNPPETIPAYGVMLLQKAVIEDPELLYLEAVKVTAISLPRLLGVNGNQDIPAQGEGYATLDGPVPVRLGTTLTTRDVEAVGPIPNEWHVAAGLPGFVSWGKQFTNPTRVWATPRESGFMGITKAAATVDNMVTCEIQGLNGLATTYTVSARVRFADVGNAKRVWIEPNGFEWIIVNAQA